MTEYVINRKGREVRAITIMEFERGKCWRENAMAGRNIF